MVSQPKYDETLLTGRSKTFAYFLQVTLPSLPDFFPSAIVQKAAFGAAAYLINHEEKEKEGVEMERREAEVWGLAAALAVNAPEDQQTNLVAALREKVNAHDLSQGGRRLTTDSPHRPIGSKPVHRPGEGRDQAAQRKHVLERSRSRRIDDRVGLWWSERKRKKLISSRRASLPILWNGAYSKPSL